MTADRPSISYIGLVIVAGAVITGHAFWTWHSADPGKFLSYLLIAMCACGMKIRLPSVTGTMSVSFLFLLIGVAEFSLSETLLMGIGGTLVQTLFHARARPTPVQVIFNLASTTCAIKAAWLVQHAPGLHSGLLTAASFFLANTLSVAIVIALTEHRNVWGIWRGSYLWSFPNYLVGAAVVWLVGETDRLLGWQAALLLFPVFYFVYRSHRMYAERLEQAKARADQEAAHATEVAAMHRRTIETLALAVEAKDPNTHDHLRRVETYAVEVGRDLGFGDTQIAELRAAALLHDIGKLAVPEYIIAKPGKLTRAEFAKMKTHTVVGAEIVDRMHFPYDVAPIVRGHHEKWDGSGYPDGLVGDQIPLGARIMAAVDCLDALSSDRHYRRAMPLAEAVEVIRSEAAKSFDPQVVEILARRYIELETMAKSGAGIERLPIGVQVERGDAPAAGFEKTSPDETTRDLSALQRSLVGPPAKDCSQGESPYLPAGGPQDAVLTKITRSLRETVTWDAMAVYGRNGEKLTPLIVHSLEFRGFLSGERTLGEGVSGWVAKNGQAIVNANPSVEPGYLRDPPRFSALRSALVVPLITGSGIVGVLSLYRTELDGFTTADLDALISWSPAFSAMVDRAMTVTVSET